MNEGNMEIEQHTFGWFNRRLKNNDHLVILGYDEETGRFFCFDQRQINVLVKQLSLPIIGHHDPTVRATAIIDSISPRWSRSCEVKYYGSITMSKQAISHRHFVLVRAFSVSESLRQNKSSDFPVGYTEFTRDEMPTYTPQHHRAVIARMMNLCLLKAQTAA